MENEWNEKDQVETMMNERERKETIHCQNSKDSINCSHSSVGCVSEWKEWKSNWARFLHLSFHPLSLPYPPSPLTDLTSLPETSPTPDTTKHTTHTRGENKELITHPPDEMKVKTDEIDTRTRFCWEKVSFIPFLSLISFSFFLSLHHALLCRLLF